MPASQFFLMKEQSQKIKAAHYWHLTKIAGISICGKEYFKTVESSYRDVVETETKPEHDPEPPTPPVNTATVEGQNAVLLFTKAFRKGKGG